MHPDIGAMPVPVPLTTPHQHSSGMENIPWCSERQVALRLFWGLKSGEGSWEEYSQSALIRLGLSPERQRLGFLKANELILPGYSL